MRLESNPKKCVGGPSLHFANIIKVLHHFFQLLEKVTENEKEWKYWCDTEAPEEEEIPCGYKVDSNWISKFERE